MKQIKTNSWFTLVELIVVITILVILWTIAFISLEWYSSQARDSKRLSDVQNIKTSLELFSLNTWEYPTPDLWVDVLYDTEIVWKQWIVWDNVTSNLSRNLNKKPIDPLTESEYIYSLMTWWTKYELLSIYESVLVSDNNLLSTANAENQLYPKIDWTYNWIFVKTTNYYIPTPSIINSELNWIWWELTDSNIKSQIITGWENNIDNIWIDTKIWWLDWMNLEVFSWTLDEVWEDDNLNKRNLLEKIQNAYSWTVLSNNWVYKEIVNIDLASLGTVIYLMDNLIYNKWKLTWIITQKICEAANWVWIPSNYDVYIWSNQSKSWFCISPTVNFWDSNDWFDWISWNWWWDYDRNRYNWWDTEIYTDMMDSWLVDSLWYGWQTRKLESPDWYTCKRLWDATKWYTNNLNIDNKLWEDTLENRMRYLSKYKNTYDNIISSAIDWIDFWTIWPINGHAIPALYLADCIDWKNDLTKSMTYTHKDNTIEEITYEEYSEDVDLLEMWWEENSSNLSSSIYQNRQKYLTAWTQQSWSHLPSAFSYIDNETAWWELQIWSLTNWEYFQNDNVKWEYQMACENNYLWIVYWDDATKQYRWWEDHLNSERIWLSAIGESDGSLWWKTARLIVPGWCWGFQRLSTGHRGGTESARFVIRP